MLVGRDIAEIVISYYDKERNKVAIVTAAGKELLIPEIKNFTKDVLNIILLIFLRDKTVGPFCNFYDNPAQFRLFYSTVFI